MNILLRGDSQTHEKSTRGSSSKKEREKKFKSYGAPGGNLTVDRAFTGEPLKGSERESVRKERTGGGHYKGIIARLSSERWENVELPGQPGR